MSLDISDTISFLIPHHLPFHRPPSLSHTSFKKKESQKRAHTSNQSKKEIGDCLSTKKNQYGDYVSSKDVSVGAEAASSSKWKNESRMEAPNPSRQLHPPPHF